MKFNPITNDLFTNDGTFIKRLHCPLNMQWNSLTQAIPLKGKMCDHCDKVIIDSRIINDEQLIELLQQDQHTCLKISPDQPNVFITHERHTNQP